MLFNYSAARLCQRWAINPDWATQSYTNRRACVCLSVCTCDCVKAVCSPRALLKVLCVFVWCVHMWELVLYINSRAACVCVFIAEVWRFGWESRPVEYGEEGNSRRSVSRESCVCWNIKQKKNHAEGGLSPLQIGAGKVPRLWDFTRHRSPALRCFFIF